MCASRTVCVIMATAAGIILCVRASFAETVGVWIQVEPVGATFTTDPNGNPDTIQAKCRNKTIKSNGATVLNDPINDGAQVTAQGDTHDGTDQQGIYHYTTATVEGRAGIGAVYEVKGVEVVLQQGGQAVPGGIVVGGGPWWARARDKSLGALYLADNILGYGCSEAYQYAPGDNEFYCGSTEKGWGDVRVFTDRAPATGKTWFAVLYRTATQIGVYPLAQVPGESRWQTPSFPGDLLFPVHYSVKLVQAANQDGVPAALGADPPPPAITFAVVHGDLDIDSDNDGVIRTGFDAEGKPIPLDNPARAWDDSCEAAGLAHVLPMRFDTAGKIADSARTAASALVRPRDVNRGVATLVNAGTCYTQLDGGTPLTSPIWNLGEAGVAMPDSLYISFPKTRLASLASGTLQQVELQYKWKYTSSRSQYLDTHKLTDPARVILTPPISVAPRHNVVKIWVPLDGAINADGTLSWEGVSLGPKEVVRQLQTVGWTFEIYTIRPKEQAMAAWNATPGINALPLSVFKQCSYDAYRQLPNGAGIIISHQHGGLTGTVPYYFTNANDPHIPSWQVEDGQPINGITIQDLAALKFKTIAGTVYRKEARVTGAWFAAKWKATNDGNEAIVWFMSCMDAGGLAGVVDAAGGRARIGYCGVTSGDNHQKMATALFGQMKQAEARTLAVALDVAKKTAPWYTSMVARGESGKQYWTTLNPGIVKIGGSYGYAMFPRASDFGTRTWVYGGVIFDTSMKNASANACVICSVEIPNRSWLAYPVPAEGLRYSVRSETLAGHATLTVVAEECRNECAEGEAGRKLTTPKGYGVDDTWSY